MASVVGSSYLRWGVNSHIGIFFKNISKWNLLLKRAGFFIFRNN